MARALYKDCEIYVLDDCLTALDAHVKNHVFKESIRNFLKDKLIILATNNAEYVQDGDNLMVMENGTIQSFTKATTNDIKNIFGVYKSQIPSSDENEGCEHDESVHDKNDNEKNDTEKTRLLNKDDDNSRRRNIYHEVKKSSRVGRRVYKNYISYGGGFFMLSFIMIFFILTQSSKSYTEKLVSLW